VTRWHLALVLLSAGAHALAFPPWNVSAIAWVALVPFLSCVGRLSPPQAALAGLLWGSAAIWAVAGWVAPAISFYYDQPWWFGVLFCLVGCVLLWGVHYAVFGLGASWLGKRAGPATRPLVLAALWVACELARARFVMGEPWMLLGYSLTTTPLLIQAADLGGVYVLSFVVALVNTTLAELLHHRARTWTATLRQLAVPAVAVTLLAAYGYVRLAWPPAGEARVPVAVVQGNNELRRQWRREFYGEGLERYLQLSRDTALRSETRLLVWPESGVTFFVAEEPAYRARIGRVLQVTGTELIVGAPFREVAANGAVRAYNSAFLLDQQGNVRARYDKVRLLPFAEYFPLKFVAFLRRHFEQVRNFAAGEDVSLLPTPAGPAALVICFEAIFPELVRDHVGRGAELLVNLSNDIWLAGAGPAQHLQMVVLRAVENRRWVIRATTTGVSAIIDPLGRIQARSDSGVEAVLTARVQPLRTSTLYQTVGDAFGVGCLLASMAAVAALSRRRVRV
jgi:apolipoprotein N-acyltransferase